MWQIFRQLDVEGDGQLDVLQLRKTLSIYPSEGPFTDISIMVTALKLCSLTPGQCRLYRYHSSLFATVCEILKLDTCSSWSNVESRSWWASTVVQSIEQNVGLLSQLLCRDQLRLKQCVIQFSFLCCAGMVDVYSSHSMDTRHHATSILDVSCTICGEYLKGHSSADWPIFFSCSIKSLIYHIFTYKVWTLNFYHKGPEIWSFIMTLGNSELCR